VGHAFEVGNGARDLQDAVVRARAQALLHHGALQQALAFGREVAEGADLARTHLRIRVNTLARGREAVELRLACAHHALQYLRRAFRRRSATQLFVIHRGNVNVDINAVDQRARDLGEVTL